MSLTKTDLAKNLAKKIEGQLKSSRTPARFGKKAEPVAQPAPAPAEAAPKLVAISCRLPAPLVAQLRAKALEDEGGMTAVLTAAVEQFLGKKPRARKAAKATD